jgi:hypothetical protein
MTAGGRALQEALRWLAVAREDLRIAEACIALQEPALGGAAYHLQQAAEKAVKGILTLMATPFRRTHDLEEPGFLAATVVPEAGTLFGRLAPITVWNTAYRYPAVDIYENDPPDVGTLNEVRCDVKQVLALLAGRVSGQAEN